MAENQLALRLQRVLVLASVGLACGGQAAPRGQPRTRSTPTVAANANAQPTVPTAPPAARPYPALQCSKPSGESPFKLLGSTPARGQVWALPNALVVLGSFDSGPEGHVIDSTGVSRPPALTRGLDLTRIATVSGRGPNDLYVTAKRYDTRTDERMAGYRFRGNGWVPDSLPAIYNTLDRPVLPNANGGESATPIGELAGAGLAVFRSEREIVVIRGTHRAVPDPVLPEAGCDRRYDIAEILDGLLTAVITGCRGSRYLVRWPKGETAPDVTALPAALGAVEELAITRRGTIVIKAADPKKGARVLRFREGKLTEIAVDMQVPERSPPQQPKTMAMRQIGDDGVFMPLMAIDPVTSMRRILAVVIIDADGSSRRVDIPPAEDSVVDGTGAIWLARARASKLDRQSSIDQICRVLPGATAAEEVSPPAPVAHFGALHQMADGSVLAQAADGERTTFYRVSAAVAKPAQSGTR